MHLLLARWRPLEMKKIKIRWIFLLLPLLTSFTSGQKQTIEDVVDFKKWLTSNVAHFAKCTPRKSQSDYLLCDGTKVPVKTLKNLFKLSPAELVKWLKEQGIKIEILCDTKSSTQPFQKFCVKQTKFPSFKKLSQLHGKYLPEHKTILIKSSASKGSLIHEYIHYKQAENTNPVYGKVYKKTRAVLQRKLTAILDRKIIMVKRLEKKGLTKKSKGHIMDFMEASELLRLFSFWQDLIDERGIFQLYLLYGSEFGAGNEDLKLAKLNMGHICKNKKILKVLPKDQCK